MTVVDSSAWIGFSRGALDAATHRHLTLTLRAGDAVLSQFVWLELTVGLRSPAERRLARYIRESASWEPLTEDDGQRAESLAARLREKGRFLSAPDLLVFTVAQRLGAKLLHCDSDFDRVLELPEFAPMRLSRQ